MFRILEAMTYPYEELGPERFQELCQALIVRDFPRAQSLPVGQADGGRDAFAPSREPANGGRLAFQVKFARNPPAIKDPIKWLAKTVEDERPKIAELATRGYTGYVLITNLQGTGFLDSGSLDQAQRILDEQSPVPASIWWRIDLDRRLEAVPELRWAYPQLLTGPDVLMKLLSSDVSQDRQRRTSALSAFLEYQYQVDEDVRFKQVDLQNKLLDLFIDVPLTLTPRSAPEHDSALRRDARLLNELATELGLPELEGRPHEYLIDDRGRYYLDESPRVPIGAATLLLHKTAQKRIPMIVLEGAPGQGKSTVAQYVCQVQRIRLLDKTTDMEHIPASHREAPLRLPLRIDLRDVAAWIAGKNPFPTDFTPPQQTSRSVETFVAAQISYYSEAWSFRPQISMPCFRTIDS